MSNKVKDINTKNRTYYFFNDIINIENVNIENIEKSVKAQMIMMKNMRKANSDDELPLNKTIEISTIAIVYRTILYENEKYYPQVSLDEYLYKL